MIITSKPMLILATKEKAAKLAALQAKLGQSSGTDGRPQPGGQRSTTGVWVCFQLHWSLGKWYTY